MKMIRLCPLLILLALAAPASAHEYRVGSIYVDHPWTVATPGGAKVGVGYLRITNQGTQIDRLTQVSTSAAAKATLHNSVREGDVVRMRPLDTGVEIKAGETVELKPDGMHIMFEGLAAPFVQGTPLRATLGFEKAGKIDVEFTVEPIGKTAAPQLAPTHQH
jgi:copper(I)-binding protein